MDNCLTVFSDASFDQGFAGVAGWGRSEIERFSYAFPVSWKVEHIGEAESIALACSIILGLDSISIPHGGFIVAQSDSLDALGVFIQQGYGLAARDSDRPIAARQGNNTMQAFTERAIRAAREAGVAIWLKHVKAHTGHAVGRSKANAWCDVNAKTMLRRARQTTKDNHKKAGL